MQRIQSVNPQTAQGRAKELLDAVNAKLGLVPNMTRLMAVSLPEDDAKLLDRLRDPDYPGKVERAIVFSIEAWDINCPQHIQKRFSEREVQPVIEKLQCRISELESQLAQREAHEASR